MRAAAGPLKTELKIFTIETKHDVNKSKDPNNNIKPINHSGQLTY
jgi:hypothetical protein